MLYALLDHARHTSLQTSRSLQAIPFGLFPADVGPGYFAVQARSRSFAKTGRRWIGRKEYSGAVLGAHGGLLRGRRSRGDMPAATSHLCTHQRSANGGHRSGWRCVSQATALGGHYIQYPEVGPGKCRHVGLAVPREDGDGRCDAAAGPLPGGDQNGTPTTAADPASSRRAGHEPRAEPLFKSLQCSARRPSSNDDNDDDNARGGSLQNVSQQ